MVSAGAAVRRRSLWTTRNGIVLALAMASSATAWWLIAWPVLTFSNTDGHAGHFALTFAHVIGGTGMLALGGLNLYLAAIKSHYPLHRRIGQSYLAFGIFGSLVAIAITLTMAHKAAGTSVFTNVTVSLLTLAFAWLASAGLGWRAGRNRRFQSHGQWMIRSYVLAWSFVFCRIASRFSDIDDLADGEAFTWLSWVAPLIICELILQWPEGARKAEHNRRSAT